MQVLRAVAAGSYFCYDNPAALEEQMQRDMRVSTGEFMSLYAWYSWPNVIICWFGGILIDRVLGLRLGTIIFALLVTAGQVRLDDCSVRVVH